MRDYVTGRRWYARRSARAEAGFVAAVAAAVRRIDANPAGGAPSVGTCRWVRAGKYPYLLHYEPTGPGVCEVYAVAHTSRRPGYWLRRISRP